MVPSNGANRLFNGGPQMHSNQSPSANNNPNAKRQNIVSTYELCHECYDTNGAHTHNNCMRNSNNSNNNNNQNNTNNHMMFSNRLANASNNSTPQKTSIQQHLLNGNKPSSCSSPNKMMSSSNSNHELRQPSSSYQQYHQHGFNGTAANNNNNNVVESSSVLGNASNQHHNNSNSETNTTSVSQQNGHVVSQKTISIGLPTNSAATNTESKSTTNVKSKRLEFIIYHKNQIEYHLLNEIVDDSTFNACFHDITIILWFIINLMFCFVSEIDKLSQVVKMKSS